MINQPQKISLHSLKTQRSRFIPLFTKKGEKSFRSAAAKCKYWILKNQFPLSFKVSYGIQETSSGQLEELTNEMLCTNLEDLGYALTVFVKERQTI